MKNILSAYANDIRDVVAKSRQGERFNFTGPELNRTQKGGAIGSLYTGRSLLTLEGIASPYSVETSQLGIHRDFAHLLGSAQTENHYIVNVFMDMKGSTQLHDVYDNDTLMYITNTVQRAAIHVCLWSGGHIQRLMGDAVFVYFGGKTISKIDAVRQALTASSMFTYFIKNDIAAIFEEDGVENISTRTGIDFGDDSETLWGTFGAGNIIELTTQSKHTSIACHCQSNASKNGIVAGDNVLQLAQLEESLFTTLRKPDGRIDYVYEGKRKGVYYKQHDFDWLKYLKSLPFIKSSTDGKLYIISPEEQEQERLERLRQKSTGIQSGNIYTTSGGLLTSQPTAVKNQPHRFHYGKRVYTQE
jgi:adenylate cyclase